MMNELLAQADMEAINLAMTWKKGGVNEKQELQLAVFPGGFAVVFRNAVLPGSKKRSRDFICFSISAIRLVTSILNAVQTLRQAFAISKRVHYNETRSYPSQDSYVVASPTICS